MTFAELLIRLSAHGLTVPAPGDPQRALETLLAHPVPDACPASCDDILATLVAWCRIEQGETLVSRSEVIEALGPLRRYCMAATDSPATGFALLNRFIETIDAVFDEESLDRRQPHWN